MSAADGKWIEGDPHLEQSIADILSTPIGTRVMRRDYGSTLFDLVDAPFNAATRLRMYGATAEALKRWEPRIALSKVSIEAGDAPGVFVVSIEGSRTDQPSPNAFTRLTLPLRLGAAAA